MNTIIVGNGKSIELSDNAYDTVKAVGNVQEQAAADLEMLVNRGITVEQLRADCLDGTEGSDVAEGWNEYVDALEHSLT